MSDVNLNNIRFEINKILDKIYSGRLMFLFRGIILLLFLMALILIFLLIFLSYIDSSLLVIKRVFLAGVIASTVIILAFVVITLAYYRGKRLFRILRPYNLPLYSHLLSIYELVFSKERFSHELYLDYINRVEGELNSFSFYSNIFEKRVRIALISLIVLLLFVSILFFNQLRTIKSAFAGSVATGVEGAGIVIDIGKVRKEFFFPSYTGMESITKYDDARLIEALKGTILKITVENKIVADKAYLVYQNIRSRMEKKGNSFIADVNLLEQGSIRIDFTKKGLRYSSRDIRIKIISDANPEIFISGPEELLRGSMDASVDRKVEISYSASDDYGIKSISIVVSLADGKEKTFRIKEVVPPSKEVSSEYLWDYSEIAKYVQGELMFALEAEDNDTISGPKKQRSRFYKIIVPKSSENFIKDISTLKAIRSGMLKLLSLDLTYEDISKYIDDRKDGMVEQDILRGIDEYMNKLKKKSQTYQELLNIKNEITFFNTSILSTIKQHLKHKDRNPPVVFKSLIANETGMLEKNILILQDIIDETVYITLLSLSKEISSLKSELKALVEKYEASGNEEVRIQIMALISLLEERLKEYSEIQSELNRSFSEININRQALQNFSHSVEDMVKSARELREGLKKDDMQEFKDRLKRLDEMMGDMESDFSNMLSTLDSDRYRELMERLHSMSEEIQDILNEQRKVFSEISSMEAEQKKRYYESIKEKLNSLLKAIIDDAEKLRYDIKENSHIIKKKSGEMNEYRVALEVQTTISQMIDLLKNMQIFDSLFVANNMVSKLEWINNIAKIFSQDKEYQGMTESFHKRGIGIRDKIKSIIENSKSSLSQIEKKSLDKLIKNEERLSQRISELSRKSEELRGQFGNSFEKLNLNLKEATQESVRSISAMWNKNIPLARSNVDNSISKLDDALKDLSKLKSRRSKMLSYGDEGEEDGERRRFRTAEVKFPKKEDFKPDEKVREEIMKALQEDEIKGYEDAIREYYEEIIK